MILEKIIKILKKGAISDKEYDLVIPEYNFERIASQIMREIAAPEVRKLFKKWEEAIEKTFRKRR